MSKQTRNHNFSLPMVKPPKKDTFLIRMVNLKTGEEEIAGFAHYTWNARKKIKTLAQSIARDMKSPDPECIYKSGTKLKAGYHLMWDDDSEMKIHVSKMAPGYLYNSQGPRFTIWMEKIYELESTIDTDD